MVLLALDPGTEYTGVAFLAEARITALKVRNDVALEYVKKLGNTCGTVIIEEFAGFGMNVGQSTFTACRWAGRFEQAAIDAGADVVLVKRKQIVRHFTGTNRGGDTQVRRGLTERYGNRGTASERGPFFYVQGNSDSWSATALAIYVYEQQNNRRWLS